MLFFIFLKGPCNWQQSCALFCFNAHKMFFILSLLLNATKKKIMSLLQRKNVEKTSGRRKLETLLLQSQPYCMWTFKELIVKQVFLICWGTCRCSRDQFPWSALSTYSFLQHTSQRPVRRSHSHMSLVWTSFFSPCTSLKCCIDKYLITDTVGFCFFLSSSNPSFMTGWF